MPKIGIDAMGGDFAPLAVVQGAILASKLIGTESTIVLFGDRAEIEAILERENCDTTVFEIVHTTQVLGMDDQPAQAFIKKPDSSVAVGFKYLMEGKIDGFASAGSTGAMMVGCMYTVKQIMGVIRPTISTEIPNLRGGTSLVLDVGLNVDCKPEVLYQYGVIGNAYAKAVMGIDAPRVALLNIGEEREKGNCAVRATYELMEGTTDFNFVGNVEAKQVLSGEIADVIVCDGFVGNSILKMAESFYGIAIGQGLRNEFIDRLNYETVGGTPVLGINSTVVVGHGCSSATAIQNMIIQTEKNIQSDLVTKLQEIFN